MSPQPTPAARIVRAVRLAVLVQALLLAFFVAGTHGVFAKLPKPTSTDYVSFYAAGALANEGRAADAYARATHHAAEERAAEPGIAYQFYFNPPVFTLLMAPLARLPYLVSFVLFDAATLALWLVLGTRVAGGGMVATTCLLAVPSVWWVLGLGQNAFLSASLLAGGTLLLRTRPLLAGLLLGALCYKPHYGLLLPVVLLAARQWRAMLGAAISVLGLTGAATLLFGRAVWPAFFAMVARSGDAIGSGQVEIGAHIEPRGALWHLGLAHGAGDAVHGVIALIVAGVLAWMWRRRLDEAAFAALVAGALIVAPFSLFYDLVLASLAAAWLVRAARRDGFLPGERAVLLAAMGLNLVHYWVAVAWGLPVSPGALVAPLLLGLALRRRWHAAAGKW